MASKLSAFPFRLHLTIISNPCYWFCFHLTSETSAEKSVPSNLPILTFEGTTYLIRTGDHDLVAYDNLSKEKVVAIDFEWQPDTANTNHPIALAQVSTLTHCYVWCLFEFADPCPGLANLLLNESIKKVGCGLRSADVRKLEVSGYDVPQTRDLPRGFIDIQDYRHPSGLVLAWTNLKYLVNFYCHVDYADKKINHLEMNWSNVISNWKLLNYAVLDAYSTLLVHNAQKELTATWKDNEASSAPLKAFEAGQVIPNKEYVERMMVAIQNEMKVEHHACHTDIFTMSFSEAYSHAAHAKEAAESLTDSERGASDLIANSIVMNLVGDSVSAHFYPGCRFFLFDDIACDFNEDFVVSFQPTLVDGTYFVFDKLSDFDFANVQIGQIYYAKRIFNPVPFQRQLDALQSWNNGLNPLLNRIILGSSETVKAEHLHEHNEVAMNNILSTQDISHPMNTSQRRAVHFAVTRSFAMIHGPPGTGKSHTLTALVHYLFKSRQQDRILVCAPSNEATDHLARRLIEALGADARKNLCVIKSKSRISFYRRSDVIRSYFWSEEDPPTCRIVCCTLSMSGGAYLKDERFKYVIIDEASQCIETECLVAVAHHTQHLILAGDHKQLGPVVLSNVAKEAQLERSLFERLMQTQEANGVQLKIQYRMHPDISIWPNQHFYNGTIQDGTTREALKLPLPLKTILQIPKQNPISFPSPNVFVDIRGLCTKTRMGSSSNKDEEIAALSLFTNLVRAGVGKVVILTPYLGQAGAINLTARNRRIKGFENRAVAYTISQFQGQEADVVILSLVRSYKTVKIRNMKAIESNATGIGFTAEPKRINVGLTRARKAMFVLGDALLLKTNELWYSALQHYAKNRSLFHGIPNHATVGLEISELPAQDIITLLQTTIEEIPLHPNVASSSASPATGASRNNASSAPISSATKPVIIASAVRAAAGNVNGKLEAASHQQGAAPSQEPAKPYYRNKRNHPGVAAPTAACSAHVAQLQQWLEYNNFPPAKFTGPFQKAKTQRPDEWTCTANCAGRHFTTFGSRKASIHGACLLALQALDTDNQFLPRADKASASASSANGGSKSAPKGSNAQAKQETHVAAAALVSPLTNNPYDILSTLMTSLSISAAAVGPKASIFASELPHLPNISGSSQPASSSQPARSIAPSSSSAPQQVAQPAQVAKKAAASTKQAKQSQPAVPKPTPLETAWLSFCDDCTRNGCRGISYNFRQSGAKQACSIVVHDGHKSYSYSKADYGELTAFTLAAKLVAEKLDFKAAVKELSEQEMWEEFCEACDDLDCTASTWDLSQLPNGFRCTAYADVGGKQRLATAVGDTRKEAISRATTDVLRKIVSSFVSQNSPPANCKRAIDIMLEHFDADTRSQYDWTLSGHNFEEDSDFLRLNITLDHPLFGLTVISGNWMENFAKAATSAIGKAKAYVYRRN